MILEWLVVEGWRCFANRLEIGEFSERINVIHGPNGSGKSSLMLALVRGLFDNHSVTGEKIEQLRPWGRDLAPRVTIQFLHNGTRYRIQKQFLRSADSVLERFEDGRFVRLAQGRAADEHARSLFEADVPGRGATDRRHWGLAQILWSPQGQLPFDQVSDNTLQAIRQALGVQLVAAGSSQVETKIREQYERYYTPKGKLRTGAQAAPLAAWEQELKEKQQRRMELQDQLARYEATSQEIRDRTHALQQLDQTLKQLQDSLEHERQRARRYEALEQQRQLKETELRALEAEYGRIDERIRQIHDLENNLNATEQTRRQLDELTPQYGSAVERYQRLVADAQQKLAEIRQRRPLVQAAQREAHSAARFAALKAHEQQLDHRLAQLQRLANDRQQLLQRIENLVAPDEKRFRQIRSAAEQRDRLKLQLDNSVITVRLHPEVPAALDIRKGDIPGKHSAAPGTAVVIRGKPDVVFHVDGLGRIEATGPVSDTSSLEEQWRAVCRGFGGADGSLPY
ncbi:MAG: hypothetical protein KatS3mg110_1391 [Pirellulaceae bacterium]|nr:MAG: hypothetical protein KatS3mg110_1391 [Pirellulaceae bacterium]